MMGEINILHNRNEYTNEVQTVREHCENTANLCKEYAIPEMEDLAYAAGKAHDIGKYQEGFQKKNPRGKYSCRTFNLWSNCSG